MKKILILTISLLGTLGLTACSPPKIVNFKCKDPTQCEGEIEFPRKKSSNTEVFDANNGRINLSQSNVNLTSNNGTAALTIKNSSGTVVASSVFDWYRSGNYIYASNPTTLNNWVNSNMQVGDELITNLSNLHFDANNGNNTLTAIIEYGNDSIGASASYYLNNADLNGF